MLKLLKTKNVSKLLLAFTMPFFILTSAAHAGSKTDGTWENISWTKYNLKFSLPAGVKETENTDNKYIAESKSLTFEMYPWKDASLNEKEVADAAYADLGIDESTVKITSKSKRDLNGFSGYEILGEGKIDGKEVNFSVLGFIDPNSSNNFAAYILYWKDGSEDINIETERDIIESIAPIK